MDKKTSEIIFTRPGKPPVDSSNEKGEIITDVLIPEDTKGKKKQTAKRPKKSGEPRSEFLDYCADFPIDYFQIPRPLRTKLFNSDDTSDSDCALMALSLLGIPHDSDLGMELEPVGWLKGPHLIINRLKKDWFVAFDGEQLKEVLKRDPWLVVTDSVVQLAIGILRVKIEQGTPRESNWAKQILKEVGIHLFIPERAKKRRTDEISLRYYSNDPAKLIASVKLYEFVIRKYWKPPYKRNESQKKKVHCGEAFRLIFKKDMPPKLIEGEKNSSPANVALAFIGHETKANYTSLHNMFYSKSEEVTTKEDIYSKLDLITDNKGDKLSFLAELKNQYTSY